MKSTVISESKPPHLLFFGDYRLEFPQASQAATVNGGRLGGESRRSCSLRTKLLGRCLADVWRSWDCQRADKQTQTSQGSAERRSEPNQRHGEMPGRTGFLFRSQGRSSGDLDLHWDQLQINCQHWHTKNLGNTTRGAAVGFSRNPLLTFLSHCEDIPRLAWAANESALHLSAVANRVYITQQGER